VDETEWMACQEPQDLLAWLWLCGKVSHRKRRLFAVACGRHIRHVFTQDSVDLMEQVLAVNERYADGSAGDREVDEASRVAAGIAWEYDGDPGVCYDIFQAVDCDGEEFPNRDCASHAVEWAVEAAGDRDTDRSALSVLLRDIFGNPFAPSTPLSPAVLAWNDGTVRRIAEGIYEERAFERLPILADALLDAGCHNEELMAHCRSEGPHVKGCWAVDLILGRQ
jgi:hypothetical protein